MAAKGWWNAAWTQGIRRILLISAVMLSLVAAATATATVVVVAVDNRGRPPDEHPASRPIKSLTFICSHQIPSPPSGLMVKADQQQVQKLMEEWRVEGWEDSKMWRKRWQPSSPSGGGSDLKNKKRQLIGSWPPTCRAKCGGCTPCQAVHVPIQPGRSSLLEYYPETWRCKCGNSLFTP